MPEDMEARMVNEVVSQLGNARVFKRLVATIDRPKAMNLNFTKKWGVGACMRFMSSIMQGRILRECGLGVK